MRIGLGPSNNLSIEISHHSASVAVFSHAVLLVCGHVRPDNFNSATEVKHVQLITAHNRLTHAANATLDGQGICDPG